MNQYQAPQCDPETISFGYLSQTTFRGPRVSSNLHCDHDSSPQLLPDSGLRRDLRSLVRTSTPNSTRLLPADSSGAGTQADSEVSKTVKIDHWIGFLHGEAATDLNDGLRGLWNQSSIEGCHLTGKGCLERRQDLIPNVRWMALMSQCRRSIAFHEHIGH